MEGSPEVTPSGNGKNGFLADNFSFHGRIGRLHYFLGTLIATALPSVIGPIATLFLLPGLFMIFAGGVAGQSSFSALGVALIILPLLVVFGTALVCLYLSLAFAVRRFHDLGKSGWWLFAALIPIYNFYLGLGLLTERGAIGPNKYGDDPLPPAAPQTDFLDRYVGKNKIIRGVLVALLVFLWIGLFALNIRGRMAQQQSMNQIINQAVQYAEQGQLASYRYVIMRTSSQVPGCLSVAPSCYAIKVPQSFAPVSVNEIPETVNSFPGFAILKDPTQKNPKNFDSIDIRLQCGEGVDSDLYSNSSTYGPGVISTKTLAMTNGFIGKEQILDESDVHANNSWLVAVGVPSATFEIYPSISGDGAMNAFANNPYEAAIGEAIANSIAPSSCESQPFAASWSSVAFSNSFSASTNTTGSPVLEK
jgi:uncharacterized membrane protein YhaH (DUF805 family)